MSFLTGIESVLKRVFGYSPLGLGSSNQVFDQSISTNAISPSHKSDFCLCVTHDVENSNMFCKILNSLLSWRKKILESDFNKKMLSTLSEHWNQVKPETINRSRVETEIGTTNACL